MPSTSKKQHRFMEMIAHDPKKAKQLGIKQSVGKDFVAADKGKKFKVGGLPQDINKQKTHHTDGGVPNFSIKKYAGLKGGGMATMKHDDEAQDKKLIKKMIDAAEKKEPKGMAKGGSIKEAAIGSAKMGSVKTSSTRDGIAQRGCTKGKVC